MSCTVCKDTGLIVKIIDGEDVSTICKNCDAYHKKTLSYIYKQINLPETYLKYTLSSYPLKEQNKETIEKINKYVKDFQKYKKDGFGLYIWSSAPAYKDSLVVMILKEIITKYAISNVYYNTMANVINNIYANWNFTANHDFYAVTNCFDMAKVPISANSRPLILQSMYQFFNNILEKNATLIITSSYSLDEIANYGYGDIKELLSMKLIPLEIKGKKEVKVPQL